MRRTASRRLTLPEVAYAFVLLLYPPVFRHRFADEMLMIFRERMHDLRVAKVRERAAFVMTMVADVVGSLVAEHTDALFGTMQRTRSTVRVAGSIVLASVSVAMLVAAYVLVDVVVARPFPYPEPETLVELRTLDAPMRLLPATVVRAVLREPSSFASSGAYDGRAIEAQPQAGRAHVTGRRVFGDVLALLGARPSLGRLIDTQDTGSGVLVMRANMWRETFRADPAIVGKHVIVAGVSRRVVGVVDDDFRLPDAHADFYVAEPLPKLTDDDSVWRHYRVIARLRPGSSIARTQANIDVGHRPALRDVRIVPIRLDTKPEVSTMLVAGLAIASILALLALAFVLAARSDATPIERLLTLGVTIAAGVVGAIAALRQCTLDAIPHIRPLAVDMSQLPTIAACALGIVAIAYVARNANMRVASRVLFGSTLALAVALTAIAFVLGGRWQTTIQAAGGLGAEDRIVATVLLDEERTPESIRAFTAAFRRGARRTHDFASIALGTNGPLGDITLDFDAPSASGRTTIRGSYMSAEPGFLDALGFRITHGRDIAPSDDAHHPNAALVDETFARRFFGNANAVGHTIVTDPKQHSSDLHIVGVFAPVRMHDLQAPPTPVIVTALEQIPLPIVSVAARTSLPPDQARSELDAIVASADARSLISNPQSQRQIVDRATASLRYATFATRAGALLAWLLTALTAFSAAPLSRRQRRTAT